MIKTTPMLRHTFFVLIVLFPLGAIAQPTSVLDALDAAEAGQYQAAIAAIDRAARNDPWDVFFRGAMNLFDQRPREALADFKRAAAMNRQLDLDGWRVAAYELAGDTGAAARMNTRGGADPFTKALVEICTAVSRQTAPDKEWVAANLRSVCYRWVRSLKESEAFRKPIHDRALARSSAGDFAAALRDFQCIANEIGMDPPFNQAHALTLLKLGDPAGARSELDRALFARDTDKLEAQMLCDRAIANARLGAIDRASLDLMYAGARNRFVQMAMKENVEKEIAAAQALLPAKDAAALLSELEAASQSGEPFDQLVKRAASVHRAFNNTRRRYDEIHYDKCFALEQAVRRNPNDPSAYVAYARYIVDDLTLWAGKMRPRGGMYRYRWGALDTELARANSLIDKALALDPNHAGALAGKATLLHFRDDPKSNDWLRKALAALHDKDPQLLWLHAFYCERQSVAAMRASLVGGHFHAETWTSGGYEYTRYHRTPATAAEQAAASAASQEWQALYAESRAALEKLSKLPDQGPMMAFIEGERARHSRQFNDAVLSYQQALKRDPHFLLARVRLVEYNFAAAYEESDPELMDMPETSAMEHAAVLYANFHSTAYPMIYLADWNLRRNQLDKSRQYLKRARAADPANAEIHLIDGAVLLQAGKHAEAHAAFSVALALDEALANQSGISLQSDAKSTRTLKPTNIETSVVTRLYAGANHIEAGRFTDAEASFRDAIALLSMLPDQRAILFRPCPGRKLHLDKNKNPWWDTAEMLTLRSRAGLDFTAAAKSWNSPKTSQRAGVVYRRLLLQLQSFLPGDIPVTARQGLALLANEQGDTAAARRYIQTGGVVPENVASEIKRLNAESPRREAVEHVRPEPAEGIRRAPIERPRRERTEPIRPPRRRS